MDPDNESAVYQPIELPVIETISYLVWSIDKKSDRLHAYINADAFSPVICVFDLNGIESSLVNGSQLSFTR